MFNVNVNISTSISGDVDVEQGSNVLFKVRVANVPYTDADGIQHDADGLFVQGIMPLGVSAVSWTATYYRSASGPSSGTGSFVVQTTTMPAGSYVDFVVTAKVTNLTEPPETLSFKAFVSAPSAYCIIPTSKTSDIVEFSVINNRVDLSVLVASVGTYVRGRYATFTVTVSNDDADDVDSLTFQSFLPKGVYLLSWVAALTNATGQASGDCFPAAIHHIDAGGTVVYTLTVLVGPDATLGSTNVCARLNLPYYLDAIDGRNCVEDDLDVAVTDPTVDICKPLTNCLDNIACDDSSEIVGYAVIRLVTPDNVTAANLVNKKRLVSKSYRVDIDNTGCWESSPLPVNTFIISKSTGEPIPTYYEVLEYAGFILVNRYVLRLNADTTYGSSVNVSVWSEV